MRLAGLFRTVPCPFFGIYKDRFLTLSAQPVPVFDHPPCEELFLFMFVFFLASSWIFCLSSFHKTPVLSVSFHVSGFNPFYLPQWPPTVFVPICPSFPCSDKPPNGHSYPDAVLQMLDKGEYILPSTSCYILTACSVLVRGFNIYKVNIRQSRPLS